QLDRRGKCLAVPVDSRQRNIVQTVLEHFPPTQKSTGRPRALPMDQAHKRDLRDFSSLLCQQSGWHGSCYCNGLVLC
ncbi:hypothetical protein BaRGS_00014272, partial [Batillaria attramentaria]